MKSTFALSCAWLAAGAAILLTGPASSSAGDQPQWGQAWSRNLVSEERGLPASFDLSTGHNVKWAAKLGNETHSTPVVANGRVLIGTNNGEPRDPKHVGDRGVLMCFDEKTGRFQWQLAVPKRTEDRYFDWPNSGICSPATVEGDRVYIVNNRGEVMCLDLHGMANGNDGPFLTEGEHMVPRGTSPLPVSETDADIIWLFDLTAGAGIWSHDAANSSILIHGPYLYLNTGTGVDNTHKRIRTPDAPSLVVIEKATGRLVAREREGIAPRIFHSTWSSPSMAEINGKPLIFFAGGDGVIYAFKPVSNAPPHGEVLTLEKAWQFDCDPSAPKEDVHRYNGNRRVSPSNIYGMPVFHRDRIYVAGGGDIFWGKNVAWLQCIDASQQGDATADTPIWSYPLERHVLSTPAIHDGIAFIADCGRKMHAVNAESGQPYWTHDITGEVWASPFVADGKVYLGARNGDFWVFAASKEKEVLSKIPLGSPISASACAANGVLYVATMTHLYAVTESGR
jgi:outer membrane protein assembly factor BamB